MIEAGANEVPEDQMIEAILQSSRSKPGDHQIHRYNRS